MVTPILIHVIRNVLSDLNQKPVLFPLFLTSTQNLTFFNISNFLIPFSLLYLYLHNSFVFISLSESPALPKRNNPQPDVINNISEKETEITIFIEIKKLRIKNKRNLLDNNNNNKLKNNRNIKLKSKKQNSAGFN